MNSTGQLDLHSGAQQEWGVNNRSGNHHYIDNTPYKNENKRGLESPKEAQYLKVDRKRGTQNGKQRVAREMGET